MTDRRFDGVSALSFDCYGTLVDWEHGIIDSLTPWLQRHDVAISDNEILETFARHESSAETSHPRALYRDILERVVRAMAIEWNVPIDDEEARSFARSVGSWPPFPDTVDALVKLGRRFRLAILSNVDRQSFADTQRRLGIDFDLVCTAEEIGSYKPDERNFRFLLDRMREIGIEPPRILHVAQSLYHDHVPARRSGLSTCWIDRRAGRKGGGATPPPPVEVKPDMTFTSLAALAAAAVEQAPR